MIKYPKIGKVTESVDKSINHHTLPRAREDILGRYAVEPKC